MPPSTTPGSSNIHKFQSRDVDVGLRQGLSGSALPNLPQSVSRGYGISRLPGSLICYGLPVCTPPCTDLTRSPQPSRAFTFGLQVDWSPSPPPDTTTTVTGPCGGTFTRRSGS